MKAVQGVKSLAILAMLAALVVALDRLERSAIFRPPIEGSGGDPGPAPSIGAVTPSELDPERSHLSIVVDEAALDDPVTVGERDAGRRL